MFVAMAEGTSDGRRGISWWSRKQAQDTIVSTKLILIYHLLLGERL
jgi:hypothetical protein